MAITNYNELKSAIARWMKRSDMAESIPDFITLAESKLNRRLRLKSMEVAADLTLDAQEVDFPEYLLDDVMVELVSISIGGEKLTKVQYEQLQVSATPGKPSSYAVRDVIVLNCPPDQTYEAKAHILKELGLSGSNQENWLLSNHPDVYLFASLVESTAFAKQPIAVITAWNDRLEQAIAEVNNKEARSKRAALRTDVAAMVRG